MALTLRKKVLKQIKTDYFFLNKALDLLLLLLSKNNKTKKKNIQI